MCGNGEDGLFDHIFQQIAWNGDRLVFLDAWQYREFFRIKTYQLNLGSTCGDKGVEVLFDFHVDFLGWQLLDDLHEKLGWQNYTARLIYLNYAFISIFKRDEGLNGYIGVTCCQRYTLMIHVEFDTAQNWNRSPT
ncbi:hypothetical protein D3C74_348380 [compost metagenome]